MVGQAEHERPEHAGFRADPGCLDTCFKRQQHRHVTPDGIDKLARRSREFLEAVLAGLERNLTTTAA